MRAQATTLDTAPTTPVGASLQLRFKRLRKAPEDLDLKECLTLIEPTVTTPMERQELEKVELSNLQQRVAEFLKNGYLDENALPKRGKLPTKGRDSDLGIDFYADEEATIPAGGYRIIKTGIAWACPPGWGLVIRDRSSLGSKGITHTAGVIDCEYRGEWLITLANLNDHPYVIKKGDKICQGVLVQVPPIEIHEEEGPLPDSDRGAKGFGSSGR